jgi:hypothetical protein
MKNYIKVEIRTHHLLEYQDFIDRTVKDIFNYPECKVVMDLFLVSGGKKVVYKVGQSKKDIKVIKEKLVKKLSQKINDVDIEINNPNL